MCSSDLDGSGKTKGVRMYIDGVETALNSDKDDLKDTIRTTAPLTVGQRSEGHEFERGRVQDLRIYNRRLSSKEVKTLALVIPIREAITLAADKRTKEQNEAIFDYWITTRDKAYTGLVAKREALTSERDAIKERNPVTHVQREKKDSMPMANILFRGQYDKKKDQVILPIYLPGSLDPRFSTCGEARARGYGPYYINVDAEYWWYVDADADGIVCEPYYP